LFSARQRSRKGWVISYRSSVVPPWCGRLAGDSAISDNTRVCPTQCTTVHCTATIWC